LQTSNEGEIEIEIEREREMRWLVDDERYGVYWFDF